MTTLVGQKNRKSPNNGPQPQASAHRNTHSFLPYTHSDSSSVQSFLPSQETPSLSSLMAASSTLCNFLTFFLPTKSAPPPKIPPPPNLNLPPSPAPFPSQTHKPSRHLAPLPLVPQDHDHTSSSSSSSSSLLGGDLSSVVCPSLAFANTLFFKSAYNVQVVVDENEPEERLLNRFRREVMKAGIIQDCRRRRYHEDSQDKRKRKSREAAKRNRRRSFPFSFSSALVFA